jgi:hypothetical protein
VFKSGQEFIRFLNAIEAAVPAGRIVHVILDNYATHKHSGALAWLSRHPRQRGHDGTLLEGPPLFIDWRMFFNRERCRTS